MATIPEGFEFSADADRMDRHQIHTWLHDEAYWSLGRPRATQDKAMEASRNYGLFQASGRQVAYARVVTDGATFAWLCDVFVDSSFRGHGIGVALMESVCEDLDTMDLRRTMLATADAHELYRKFGFETIESTQRWMIRTGSH